MLRPQEETGLESKSVCYQVLVFSSTRLCLRSTSERASGYQAQVGGKKQLGRNLSVKVFTVFQACRVEFMTARQGARSWRATLAPSAHKTGSVYFMPANVEGAIHDLCSKDLFFFWSTKVPLLQ